MAEPTVAAPSASPTPPARPAAPPAAVQRAYASSPETTSPQGIDSEVPATPSPQARPTGPPSPPTSTVPLTPLAPTVVQTSPLTDSPRPPAGPAPAPVREAPLSLHRPAAEAAPPPPPPPLAPVQPLPAPSPAPPPVQPVQRRTAPDTGPAPRESPTPQPTSAPSAPAPDVVSRTVPLAGDDRPVDVPSPPETTSTAAPHPPLPMSRTESALLTESTPMTRDPAPFVPIARQPGAPAAQPVQRVHDAGAAADTPPAAAEPRTVQRALPLAGAPAEGGARSSARVHPPAPSSRPVLPTVAQRTTSTPGEAALPTVARSADGSPPARRAAPVRPFPPITGIDTPPPPVQRTPAAPRPLRPPPTPADRPTVQKLEARALPLTGADPGPATPSPLPALATPQVDLPERVVDLVQAPSPVVPSTSSGGTPMPLAVQALTAPDEKPHPGPGPGPLPPLQVRATVGSMPQVSRSPALPLAPARPLRARRLHRPSIRAVGDGGPAAHGGTGRPTPPGIDVERRAVHVDTRDISPGTRSIGRRPGRTRAPARPELRLERAQPGGPQLQRSWAGATRSPAPANGERGGAAPVPRLVLAPAPAVQPAPQAPPPTPPAIVQRVTTPAPPPAPATAAPKRPSTAAPSAPPAPPPLPTGEQLDELAKQLYDKISARLPRRTADRPRALRPRHRPPTLGKGAPLG